METILLFIKDYLLYIIALFALINMAIQYYWLNHLNKSVRQLAVIIMSAIVGCLVLALSIKFKIENVTLLHRLILTLVTISTGSSLIVFPISLGFRKLVHSWRLHLFNKYLKKSITDLTAKNFRKLLLSLKRYTMIYELEEESSSLLKTIYKQVKNAKNIDHASQVAFAQLLIINGLVGIELPRTYDIRIDASSNQDTILQVAYSALTEAKAILELAPNAAICTCRKYAENLTRYLIRHYQLELNPEIDGDSFSAMLYVLKESKRIDNPQIIRKLYQIKEVGNDAAHEQLCDLKTARDIYDDALTIESWFRRYIAKKTL